MAKNVRRYVEAERRLWDHIGVMPTERWVTLPSGGSVRIQATGVGDPFVLLHGGSIAGTSWATLAAALEDVRCILVDRPGCGLSDPIVGGPLRDLRSVRLYADRLLGDLLDALELETAAVGATSYGGFFAFRRRPRRSVSPSSSSTAGWSVRRAKARRSRPVSVPWRAFSRL